MTSATSDTFRRLHQEGPLLRLANVWDAGVAKLIESLGAKALATTSAGVAWAHGYPDGGRPPLAAIVGTIAEIARVVKVPLSADAEGGWSDDPAAVGRNVAEVMAAGAVGINLEDGTGSPELLCDKIAAIRAACGDRVFINARTDVYLASLAPPERRVEESIARAACYVEAGADGIFVPGVTAPDEMRSLAQGIARPLNVLARPGLSRASELEALGVRRLSAGSGITQNVYGRIATLAKAFLEDGASDPLVEGAKPYAEINRLMGG